MAEKHWYRLERNARGKLVSCIRVECQQLDDKHFSYVLAFTEDEAKDLGKAAFNEYCRVKTNERRERLAKVGICRCGRPNDRAHLGKTCCTICSKESRKAADRRKAKDKGLPFEPANRAVTVAARQEERKRDIIAAATPVDLRLAVLLEVQTKWQNTSVNKHFSDWLNAQVELLRGRRVA